MSTRRITRGQVRAVAMKLAKDQGGVCPLCNKPLDFTLRGSTGNSVVCDHSHVTGHIRGALHRGCNGSEGRVVNAVGRWAGLGMDNTEEIANWLERLVKYLRKEPYDMLYYTVRTPEELARAQKLKARKARARRKARATIK